MIQILGLLVRDLKTHMINMLNAQIWKGRNMLYQIGNFDKDGKFKKQVREMLEIEKYRNE